MLTSMFTSNIFQLVIGSCMQVVVSTPIYALGIVEVNLVPHSSIAFHSHQQQVSTVPNDMALSHVTIDIKESEVFRSRCNACVELACHLFVKQCMQIVDQGSSLQCRWLSHRSKASLSHPASMSSYGQDQNRSLKANSFNTSKLHKHP